MPNGCNNDELLWSQREAPNRLDTKYPYGEDMPLDSSHYSLSKLIIQSGITKVLYMYVSDKYHDNIRDGSP